MRLEDVFRRAGRGNKRGVLLLGDPGAGKTTGARQLCWRVASGQDAPDQLGLPPGTLPVFIRLRNLRPDDLGNGLQALMVRETELDAPKTGTGSDQDDRCLSPFSELWGFAGSLLWIFDGLDEVVDEDTRAKVCEWLVQLLQDRPRDRVLVTSRYQGYEGKVDLGETFVRFEVQPLDEVQAGTFVHTWFRVAYDRLELEPDAAKEKARSLVEMLGQPSYRIGRMAELRSNPLLLTILCLVYHEDSQSAAEPRAAVRAVRQGAAGNLASAGPHPARRTAVQSGRRPASAVVGRLVDARGGQPPQRAAGGHGSPRRGDVAAVSQFRAGHRRPGVSAPDARGQRDRRRIGCGVCRVPALDVPGVSGRAVRRPA